MIGADKTGKELAAADRVEGRSSAEPVEARVFVAVERAGGVGLGAGGKRLR